MSVANPRFLLSELNDKNIKDKTENSTLIFCYTPYITNVKFNQCGIIKDLISYTPNINNVQLITIFITN